MAESVANISLANTFTNWVDRTNEIAFIISTRSITVNSHASGALTSGNGFVNGYFGANTLVVYDTLRGGNVANSGVLNIGSNISVNGYTISVGNSTVNTIINSTSFLNGNSTVNTTANNLGFIIQTPGANLSINSESIALVNATVTFVLTKPTAAQISDGGYFLNANGTYQQLTIPFNPAQIVSSNTTGTSAQQIDSTLLSNASALHYYIKVKNNVANGITMTQLSVAYTNNTDPMYVEYGTMNSNGSLGTFTANANSTALRLFFTPTSTNTTVSMTKILVA